VKILEGSKAGDRTKVWNSEKAVFAGHGGLRTGRATVFAPQENTLVHDSEKAVDFSEKIVRLNERYKQRYKP
jgi:hypothetical protein